MAAAAVALQHQSVSVVVVKLLSLGVSGFLVGEFGSELFLDFFCLRLRDV